MQKQNIREYKFIRQELLNIKNCMTTYVGYVLGGSGAALFGLALFTNQNESQPALIFIPVILSIIISLVLFILFYKFNSHNRFAGYCKLLDYESYKLSQKHRNLDFLSWERCMGGLRDSDFAPNMLKDMCIKIYIDDMDKKKLQILVGKITGPNPAVDNWMMIKGWKIMLNAFWGKLKSKSWGFPAYIAVVFVILCLIFLIIAGYFAFTTNFFCLDGNTNNLILYIFLGVLLLCQIYMWFAFSGKLHNLMEGSATVDRFCWKFLPLRVKILNSHKITPRYGLSNHLQQRLDEIYMTKIEKQILIAAPVEKVFQFAADYLNWPKFFEGVSDFKPVTDKTKGTGSKFIYKAKMFGIKATVGTEIHDYKENEGWTGVSFKGMEHKTQWIFKQEDGNTKFTYVLSYQLPFPVLGNFLDKAFMKPAWERIIENSLQNLKRIMEETMS